MLSPSCLVIPCYNEASRLDFISMASYLERQEQLCIILVNDGSTDNTLTLLSQFATDWSERVLVIDLKQNAGKAEAVRQGVLKAFSWNEFRYIGFFDADLATPLNEIERLVSYIQKKQLYVMAVGSRMRRLGSKITRTARRHYFGRVFATLVSMMLRLPVYDTQCGAKIFDRKVIMALFEKPFVSRWLFDVELFARLSKLQQPYTALDLAVEVPLEQWTEVHGSKINICSILRVPLDLWRIYKAYRPFPKSTNS